MGSDKLKTFVHDPCSNQPSYEGSRLTMAKITNKDNICSLNSVAKLEIISLKTNPNCMENQSNTGEKPYTTPHYTVDV